MVQRHVEVGPAEGVDEFLCVATFLPVRKWRNVIPFLRMAARVSKQLMETEGLVRYGLKMDLLRRRFWTFTVWRERAALDAFISAEPHATAVS